MKLENFSKAIEIISNNGKVKVSFNVPVSDNYSNVHPIIIHESNATMIDELIKAGFSLNMNEKGLVVNKY